MNDNKLCFVFVLHVHEYGTNNTEMINIIILHLIYDTLVYNRFGRILFHNALGLKQKS